jgi:hypothetical protein
MTVESSLGEVTDKCADCSIDFHLFSGARGERKQVATAERAACGSGRHAAQVFGAQEFDNRRRNREDASDERPSSVETPWRNGELSRADEHPIQVANL